MAEPSLQTLNSCSVCLLCGLPGAGKTTFAKYLQQNSPGCLKFVHVCYDSLMPNVKFEDEINAWKNARGCILGNVSALLRFIKDRNCSMPMMPHYDKNVTRTGLVALSETVKGLSSAGCDVVFLIDDNMQYRGMRHEYYRMCCDLHVGFCIVYFDVAVEKCLVQNEKRPIQMPDVVVRKINSQMEVPGCSSKCKWEKHICVIDGQVLTDLSKSWDILCSVLQNSMNDPPSLPEKPDLEEQKSSRLQSRKSFVHQADICMRKFISSEIDFFKSNASKSSTNFQEFCKNLSVAKQKLMLLLKTGYIDENFVFDASGVINTKILQERINILMKSVMS